jgi:very-short-patch-repair endonuclease
MSGSRKAVKVDGKSMSHLEAELLFQLKAAKLTEGMKQEYRFHPVRMWRFDFAWPEEKIAVEVQGGIWLGKSGAHTSAKGRARDCEKSNAATVMGYRVLQFTSEHIKKGVAVALIEKVLTEAAEW